MLANDGPDPNKEPNMNTFNAGPGVYQEEGII
jgi:hypothetical protein